MPQFFVSFFKVLSGCHPILLSKKCGEKEFPIQWVATAQAITYLSISGSQRTFPIEIRFALRASRSALFLDREKAAGLRCSLLESNTVGVPI